MNKNNVIKITSWIILVSSLLFSCSKDEDPAAEISLLSSSLNGSKIESNNLDIKVDATLTLNFSAAIDPIPFKDHFTVSSSDDNDPSYTISFQNASSKAVIQFDLNYASTYEVNINAGSIGAKGEVLQDPISFSITTEMSGVVNSLAPCTSTTEDCLSVVSYGDGDFSYYSNYPLSLEEASLTDIKNAILVVHGLNRNNDDYYTWLGQSLRALDVENKTILIAPKFKIESEATGNDYYWSSTGWREGENSVNASKISSFALVDSIMLQLSNKTLFPNLKKIIVTGHSSGGLFTHLYGASNEVENTLTDYEVAYIVANSQYFYYPDDERINESNGMLYTPSGCTGYNYWPLGYQLAPSYVQLHTQEEINAQFIQRNMLYLLGNGTGSDGALNTTDCNATLLGSTRYDRGVNMYDYMNLKFTGNNHSKVIVEGIGHDGQGMYTSSEFKDLLLQELY